MSLGLYQGDKLDAGAQLGYEHLLDRALMPRVVRRLEERLRAANRDNLEQAYESLKNYLMLYTPDKFDAEALQAWVSVDWDASLERSLAPEQRQALDRHLAALLERGAPAPATPVDKNLVAGVRDMLVAFPLEYRIFSRIKRAQIGADFPPFTVAGAAGPSALNVFERASGEPLTKGIPGLYSREGYRRAFQPAVDKASRQLAAEETWVLGLRPTEATRSLPLGKANTELTNRVRRLYFEEYIKLWDAYLADVRIVKLQGLEQSLQVARTLSGVDSPLAAFLRGVARETTLVPPPPAVPVGSTSGTKVGQGDQKAAQAKRELAAVLGKVNIPGQEAVQGPASRTDGRRPLRAHPPDHVGAAAADGRDPEDVQRDLRAVGCRRRRAEEPVRAATRARAPNASRQQPGQQPEPIRSMLEKALRRGGDNGPRGRARGLDERAQAHQRRLQPGHHGSLSLHGELEGRRAPGRLRPALRRRRLLDDFYNRKLVNLVNTGTNPWSFKPRATARSRSMPRPGRLPAWRADQGGLFPQRRQDAVVQGRHPGHRDGRGPEGDRPRHGWCRHEVRRRQHDARDDPVAQRPCRVADQAQHGARERRVLSFDGPWALFPHVRPASRCSRRRNRTLHRGHEHRRQAGTPRGDLEQRVQSVPPARDQQFRCPGSL
jgi:type VI secretion system protein ImpL